MHHDHRSPALPCDGKTAGITCQGGYVVDDTGTGRKRCAHNGGVTAINRDWRAKVSQPADNRHDPVYFQINRHRRCTRACRLAADINNICSCRRHRPPLGNRIRRVVKLSGIGKAIRGDIQHTHDLWAVRGARWPLIAAPQCRQHCFKLLLPADGGCPTRQFL